MQVERCKMSPDYKARTPHQARAWRSANQDRGRHTEDAQKFQLRCGGLRGYEAERGIRDSLGIQLWPDGPNALRATLVVSIGWCLVL
jgi:hypothetical protein